MNVDKNCNKKVLFVIDNLSCGGAQKILSFLANGLSERYNHETAICSYASGAKHFELCESVQLFAGVPYRGNRITRHFRKIGFIKKCLSAFSPDIIISFSVIPSILSILSSRSKIPVVFCERGDPYQVKSFIGKMEYAFVKKASWLIFQTNGAREFFGPKINAKCSVIPNPVTGEIIPPCPQDMRRKRIAFAGRFEVKQKRQDLMVKAFSLVHRTHNDWCLDFYGDGEDLYSIRCLVDDYCLSDSVSFVGQVDNVEKRIWDYGLFVLCSDYEGIPNALIEAMCAGLPVVATDCSPGGARFLINNGENGLIVDRDDANQLAKAINFLIENPTIAQNYGLAAQEIADIYSPTIILKEWNDLIAQILGEKT